MRKKIIDMIKTVVDNDEVMSPYEFMSKTHSLSTEDLGKIFIHSFIDFQHRGNLLPYTERHQYNGEKSLKI